MGIAAYSALINAFKTAFVSVARNSSGKLQQLITCFVKFFKSILPIKKTCLHHRAPSFIWDSGF